MIKKEKFLIIIILIISLCLAITLIKSACSTIVHPTAAEVGILSSSSSSPLSPNPETSIGNGIFEPKSQHRRRWRRGKSEKKQSKSAKKQSASKSERKQFARSLSSKSMKSSSYRSKSGRRVMEELLPKEVLKKKSFLEKGKQIFVPRSRRTFKLSFNWIKKKQMHLGFEMALAKTLPQMDKKKELLKMLIYVENALTLVKELSDGTKERKKLARSNSKSMRKSKSSDLRDLQKNLNKKLSSSSTSISETKRMIKNATTFIENREKDNNKFSFARGNFMWAVRTKSLLHQKLMDWEKDEVDKWGEDQLGIWTMNHSKNEEKKRTHPLYEWAFMPPKNEDKKDKKREKPKDSKTEFKPDPQTQQEVDEFLLVDAALDRTARDICMAVAWKVPLRNWAAVAQGMDDEDIQKYFTTPMQKFHGLAISFDPGAQCTFSASADFPHVEQKSKSGIFRHIRHGLKLLFEPYEAKKFGTHQKELDARIVKCKGQLLKAMDLQERRQAIECIKGALFLKMFMEAVKENAEEQMKRLNANVGKTKKALIKAKNTHEKLHRRHRRSDSKKGDDEDDDDDDGDENDGDGSFDEEESDLDENGEFVCESHQHLSKQHKNHKQAKAELSLFKKSLKRTKSLREFLFRLTKSMRAFSSKKPMETFEDLYKEILTNDKYAKNKFFMAKLKEIEEEVMAKNGGAKMPASKFLNEYHEKQALVLFAAGPGQDFLRNMVHLSRWMTAAEVRECARHFTWIRGFSAEEKGDGEMSESGENVGIEANGDGTRNQSAGGADDDAVEDDGDEDDGEGEE
ncbi:hypothetical protein niasHT_008425 [Heterodera trifolii]|uniref:Uncharacterized protein n=1 Tax=Heterodera trifolii TaxID=157864 RepID=A0ABD2M2D1_9BILA